MSENGDINTVFVEQRLKSVLARGAGGPSRRGVPRPMAADDQPGSDRTIHARQIRFEKLNLLIGKAERAAIKMGRAIGAVRSVVEVGLGV